jgi:AAA+ superfamily predicted ATPase
MHAEDLDPAVLDRVDEQLEVALPTAPLREQILPLHFNKYLVEVQDASRGASGVRALVRGVTTLFSGRTQPTRSMSQALTRCVGAHPCCEPQS